MFDGSCGPSPKGISVLIKTEMQRMVPLFLIYLFLLTAILWIPAPYRLTREGFTTEFTLKDLDKSPATAQADAAAEVEKTAAALRAEVAEYKCREDYPDDSNNYCSLTNSNIDNMNDWIYTPDNCNEDGLRRFESLYGGDVCMTRTKECFLFHSAYGCNEWNAALT